MRRQVYSMCVHVCVHCMCEYVCVYTACVRCMCMRTQSILYVCMLVRVCVCVRFTLHIWPFSGVLPHSQTAALGRFPAQEVSHALIVDLQIADSIETRGEERRDKIRCAENTKPAREIWAWN